MKIGLGTSGHPPRRLEILVAASVAVLLGACGSDDSGLTVLRTCGNGVVESGETCDPGGVCGRDGAGCVVGEEGTCGEGDSCLPADTDTCSSVCTLPKCGDGLAQGGLEQCDTFDLRDATCASFGRGDNPEGGPSGGLTCTDSCTLDASDCGPVFTPTALPTATPTIDLTPATEAPTATVTNTPPPTPTPTPPCNLPILEPGEFYDDPDIGIVGTIDGTDCPEDADIFDCTASGERYSVDVALFAALGTQPNSTTMLVGYRSDIIALGDRDREAAVDIGPNAFIFTPRDLDYAIRLVWTGTSTPLIDPEGVPLVRLTFDLCDGADVPMLEDLACNVEGCSGAGGPIADCTCEVRDATDQ